MLWGYSFTSGSDSALLYDTLKQEYRELEYKKIEGKISSYSEISAIFGSVLWSLLAHYIGNNYVFLSYGCILLFIIPLCYGLKDYVTSIHSEDKQLRKSIASIIHMSSHDRPTLKRIILYGSIISTATYIMARTIQPYLLKHGLALMYIGIALALFKVVISIASSHAHKRDRKLWWKFSLCSLLLLVIIWYTICWLANWLLVWFCWLILFQIERGLHKPIFNHAINELVDSDIRATVLSVNSMVGRFFYATIWPIIWFISDTFSLKVMLLCCVAIFTILWIWSYMNIKKI